MFGDRIGPKYAALRGDFERVCKRLEKAEARVKELEDLLRRCQSGHDSRFPQCPVCGEKWFGGPAQPHEKDCALAKALQASTPANLHDFYRQSDTDDTAAVNRAIAAANARSSDSVSPAQGETNASVSDVIETDRAKVGSDGGTQETHSLGALVPPADHRSGGGLPAQQVAGVAVACPSDPQVRWNVEFPCRVCGAKAWSPCTDERGEPMGMQVHPQRGEEQRPKEALPPPKFTPAMMATFSEDEGPEALTSVRVDLLRRIEWEGGGDAGSYCPDCKDGPPNHATHCELAAAIYRAAPRPNEAPTDPLVRLRDAVIAWDRGESPTSRLLEALRYANDAIAQRPDSAEPDYVLTAETVVRDAGLHFVNERKRVNELEAVIVERLRMAYLDGKRSRTEPALSPTKTSSEAYRKQHAEMCRRALEYLNSEDRKDEVGADAIAAVARMLEVAWDNGFETALAAHPGSETPSPCPAGNGCEHAIRLEEYEKVDRIFRDQIRRNTIEECARLLEKQARALLEKDPDAMMSEAAEVYEVAAEKLRATATGGDGT